MIFDFLDLNLVLTKLYKISRFCRKFGCIKVLVVFVCPLLQRGWQSLGLMTADIGITSPRKNLGEFSCTFLSLIYWILIEKGEFYVSLSLIFSIILTWKTNILDGLWKLQLFGEIPWILSEVVFFFVVFSYRNLIYVFVFINIFISLGAS